jgi:hypothetical protein
VGITRIGWAGMRRLLSMNRLPDTGELHIPQRRRDAEKMNRPPQPRTATKRDIPCLQIRHRPAGRAHDSQNCDDRIWKASGFSVLAIPGRRLVRRGSVVPITDSRVGLPLKYTIHRLNAVPGDWVACRLLHLGMMTGISGIRVGLRRNFSHGEEKMSRNRWNLPLQGSGGGKVKKELKFGLGVPTL